MIIITNLAAQAIIASLLSDKEGGEGMLGLTEEEKKEAQKLGIDFEHMKLLKKEIIIQKTALPISIISLMLVTAKEYHLGKILRELLKRLLQVFSQ